MNYMFENHELESSSGCESGWTLYLEPSSSSSISPYNQENNDCNYIHGRKNGAFTRSKQDEDEDMSMVSDASSGPPHLHEEEEIDGGDFDTSHYCPNDKSLSIKKKQNNEKRRKKLVQEHSSSLLDDTASSPFFDFSNKSYTATRKLPYVENVLEYSQGYSTTQFEVRPPYQDHYDFYQASTPANQLQQNQWFEDKRW